MEIRDLQAQPQVEKLPYQFVIAFVLTSNAKPPTSAGDGPSNTTTAIYSNLSVDFISPNLPLWSHWHRNRQLPACWLVVSCN
jgi:hypothetical protein